MVAEAEVRQPVPHKFVLLLPLLVESLGCSIDVSPSAVGPCVDEFGEVPCLEVKEQFRLPEFHFLGGSPHVEELPLPSVIVRVVEPPRESLYGRLEVIPDPDEFPPRVAEASTHSQRGSRGQRTKQVAGTTQGLTGSKWCVVQLNARRLHLVAPVPFLSLGLAMLVYGTTFTSDFVMASFGILLMIGSIAGMILIINRSRNAIPQGETANRIPPQMKQNRTH